jgi:hypothetical protein
MDSLRIIRFTIPGWLFFISFIFHYYLFDDSLNDYYKKLSDLGDIKSVVAIIVVLFSSPVLGYLFSCFSLSILELFYGYELHFKLPNNNNEQKMYFEVLRKYKSSYYSKCDISELEERFKEKKIKNDINDIKKIYFAFNMTLRVIQLETLNNWVLRRWNAFWININSNMSILFGIIFAFLIKLFFFGGFPYLLNIFILLFYNLSSWDVLLYIFKHNSNSYMYVFEIFFIVFFRLSWKQAFRSRQEAIEAEYEWILQHFVPGVRNEK